MRVRKRGKERWGEGEGKGRREGGEGGGQRTEEGGEEDRWYESR